MPPTISRRSASRSELVLAMIVVLAPALTAASLAQTRVRLGETGIGFEVPVHCLVREGPGTAEAVCDPDGSPDTSRIMPASAAVYFEVTAQAFDAGGSRAPESMAQRYAFADFQKDLPGAVCGEERISRIKIENPQRQLGDDRVTYSATVTCPEIKFLGLGPRRALVRYVLADGLRTNILARSLADDFERAKPVMDAFLAGLTLNTEKKP